MKAGTNLEESSHIPYIGPPKSHSKPSNHLFLHLTFHPKDPPRSALQAIFTNTYLGTNAHGQQNLGCRE
jgi:hypothetical protein